MRRARRGFRSQEHYEDVRACFEQHCMTPGEQHVDKNLARGLGRVTRAAVARCTAVELLGKEQLQWLSLPHPQPLALRLATTPADKAQTPPTLGGPVRATPSRVPPAAAPAAAACRPPKKAPAQRSRRPIHNDPFTRMLRERHAATGKGPPLPEENASGR